MDQEINNQQRQQIRKIIQGLPPEKKDDLINGMMALLQFDTPWLDQFEAKFRAGQLQCYDEIKPYVLAAFDFMNGLENKLEKEYKEYTSRN